LKILQKLYDDLAITPTRELKDQAMHIAISQNITVYEALFISAAQKINATLYTADKKICAKSDKLTKSKLPIKEG
jgi:predicted nucleic acid-binding protein